MQAQFNTLPLLSVKSGLDSSLANVSRDLESYFSSAGSDKEALQKATVELHRMGGVLRMLSLSGLVVFCGELEKLLQELAQTSDIDTTRRDVIRRALFGLTHYLDALADGATNATLRLFHEYQEMLQARGLEMAFDVDLFFPELRVELPEAILQPAQESDAANRIKGARLHYQQALLKWLRQDGAAEALRTMLAATRAVMGCVPQDQQRAFWWVAGGLLECLIHEGVPLELNVKKSLSRIDLKMKSLADGSAFDDEVALSEALYIIARSHSVSDTVEQIKNVYALDVYLPQELPMPPAESAALLDQMRAQLNTAEEDWEHCVGDDGEACQKFAADMQKLYETSERLDRNTLQFLSKQIHTAALHAEEPEHAQRISMDMAMALLLLDSGIDHYQHLGSGFQELARILSARLQAGIAHTPEDENKLANLVSLYTQMEQHGVMVPLATEMQGNLQHIEQTLNGFFNNAAKRAELSQINRLLSQVQGGLHMLSLDLAVQLLGTLRHVTERYVKGETPSAAEMRTVASAVSTLEEYVHGLVLGQRPDSAPLANALSEIAEMRTARGYEEAPAVEEEATPAGVSIRSGGEDEELLEVFLEEAREVLETLRSNLEISRADMENREPLVTMRRGFHTLKGSGRMVGLAELGEVAWAVERAMNKWLQENKPATPALLDMIGDAEVLFQHWVDMLRGGSTTATIDTSYLLKVADCIENGKEVPQPQLEQVVAAAESEPEIASIEAAPELPLAVLEPPVAVPELEAALPVEAAIPEIHLPVPEESIESEQPAAAELESDQVEVGSVSLSRVLFDIATEEAAGHIQALRNQLEVLHEPEHAVTYDFMRAAHTLAGVNRTMGFVQIAELSYNLELWLEERIDKPGVVTDQQIALIDQVVQCLDDMCATVREQRQQPAAQSELIAQLQATREIGAVAEPLPALAAAPASAAEVLVSPTEEPAEPAFLAELALEFAPPAEPVPEPAAPALSFELPPGLEMPVFQAVEPQLVPTEEPAMPAVTPEIALDFEMPSVGELASAEAPPEPETALVPELLELPALEKEIEAPAADLPELTLDFGAPETGVPEAPAVEPELAPMPEQPELPAEEETEASATAVSEITLDFGIPETGMPEAVSPETALELPAMAAAEEIPPDVSELLPVPAFDLAQPVEPASVFEPVAAPEAAVMPELATALITEAPPEIPLPLEAFGLPMVEPSTASAAETVSVPEILSTPESPAVPAAAEALSKLVEAVPAPEIEAAPAAELLPPLAEVPSETAAVPPAKKIVATTDEEEPVPQPPKKERTVHDEIDDQLLPIFLEEAHELYPQIGTTLRAWREHPADKQHGRNLQRSLHTLKGSARMAGAMRLGELTHRVEDRVEKAVATGDLNVEFWNELDNYLDRIGNAIEQLQNPQAAQSEEKPAPEAAAAPAAEQVVQKQFETTQVVAPVQALEVGAERAMQSALLRVRSDTVDRLVNEAGEVSVARSRAEQELRELKKSVLELTDSVNHLRKQLREIEIQAEGQMQARVAVASDSAEKFDPLEFDRFTRFQELTRFMNESVHDVLTVQQSLLKSLAETEAALTAQSHLNRDLQQGLMAIRMVPFSSISERLYRIVRQTGKELGKRANLELSGTEVELDRSVLERMTAPFEHLLRNSIAHGLESSEQRQQAGKEPIGEIHLSLRHESNEVVFELSDDGAGLDIDRIKRKAIENGVLQEGEEISDELAMQLIFTAGLSTASEITEISGRGVGMDVVRSEITSLGGRIDVASERGHGVRFTIHLPLTLAVTKVLLVRAGEEIYAVPSSMIENVQQLKPQALEGCYQQQYVEWMGARYPMHHLARLLGNEEAEIVSLPYNAVLQLRSGDHRLAVHVDELLGNHEVVVKNIGPQLARLPGIAGATVSSSGAVILIINPIAFTQRIVTTKRVEIKPEAVAPEEVHQVPSVMVVDDSLTVRKITSRLLARSGYQVLTAKDGIDALEQIAETLPDVMLLDVEMPRMDGFELTKRLRQDPRTQQVPIIMITSRTADKHKQHALELGVNEYMGKPFQEEELLANIARLLQA